MTDKKKDLTSIIASEKTSKINKGSFIFRFKTLIRFFVSIFASREFGFVYCMLGTASQIAHTYFLTENISSLTGGWRIAQAMGISIFISSSLLFFTAIADNSESKESKRIHLAVNLFMIIEIAINMYYYSRHLLIDSETVQIFDFLFAIVVSCLIPVTIKLYAGLIRAKDWLTEFDISETNNVSNEIDSNIQEIIDNLVQEVEEIKKSRNVSQESTEEIIHTQIEAYMDAHKDDLSQQFSESFDKHSELFMHQLQRKIQMIVDSKYQASKE